MIAGAEQERRFEASPPKRRASGGVVVELQVSLSSPSLVTAMTVGFPSTGEALTTFHDR